MSAYLRPAFESDVIEIVTAARAMLAKTPAPHMKFADATVGASHIWERWYDGKVYVYGDYAIVFDVGPPWWSEQDFLIEEFLIRFRTGFGNPVVSAIAALADLANERGCVAIVTGDTQVGKMNEYYYAAGFESIGNQFYKEM